MPLGNSQRGSTGTNLEGKDPPGYGPQHRLVRAPVVLDPQQPLGGAAMQARDRVNFRAGTNGASGPPQHGLARHLAQFHAPPGSS